MKLTLNKLKQLKQDQQKIVCLTAYDAAFAYWAATAKVEVLLVGDSLGMVVQGEATTLPVTVEQMVYHTQAVQRGNQQATNHAWVIADLPFMADLSLQTALEAASALIKQAGADMVKLEGACAKSLAITEALSRHGVPVCGHLGLLPQSVLKKGYQVVGREQAAAKQLITEAQALESAGADMLVLECVPISLAQQISETLKIPVIGIGSGADTDGQVLVSYDLVGLTPGRAPSFSKNFLVETNSIYQAFALYVAAVKQKKFPAVEHFMA